MVEKYLEKKLARKNKGIYFKKGRWLFHLVLLALMLVAVISKLQGKQLMDAGSRDLALSLVLLGPFVAFFYVYCLYLIPVLFKRNRQKQFWILLLILLLLCPLLDMLLIRLLAGKHPALAQDVSGGPLLFAARSYRDFWINFLGSTSLLYFMELLEGIGTLKEIGRNRSQLAFTELNLIKTRMNPDFMTRSLDGITHLAGQGDEAAPDAVIRFSDVLRYRLYRSKTERVPLSEELQQLDNLFRFQNGITPGPDSYILETEGDAGGKELPPLTLIHIAEPLIHAWETTPGRNLLMYLLIEETALQIAVEFTAEATAADAVAGSIRHNLTLIFGGDVIFAMETENNNHSINLCLPLHHSSTALS